MRSMRALQRERLCHRPAKSVSASFRLLRIFAEDDPPAVAGRVACQCGKGLQPQANLLDLHQTAGRACFLPKRAAAMRSSL